MKYAIVCGSAEPTYCGVGKFSAKMTKILQKRGVEVVYLTSNYQRDYHEASGDLTVTPETGHLLKGGWLDLWRFVRKHRPDILNLQYQSFHQNYFDVLYPLVVKLANWNTKVVSTVHEFEHFSELGRWRQVPTMLLSDRILFSDKRQMVTAIPYTAGLIKNKSEVVEVGPSVKSQLMEYARKPKHNPKHLHIAFHGFIQPLKGMEFLLAALENFDHPYTLHLLGKFEPILDYNIHDEVNQYQVGLKEKIENNPWLKDNIKIYGDVDPNSEKFTKILEQAELAIFPFRDGVSHRRSSLFNTFMASNAIVAATFDKTYSDESLWPIIPLGYTSQSISDFLNEYVHWDTKKRNQVYQDQKNLKEGFLSPEFEDAIYQQLVLDSNR